MLIAAVLMMLLFGATACGVYVWQHRRMKVDTQIQERRRSEDRVDPIVVDEDFVNRASGKSSRNTDNNTPLD